MNKRKLKELESLHSQNVLHCLKRPFIDANSYLDSSNSNQDKTELNNLIKKVLHIDRVCDKKRTLKNCDDNPNCIHNLGQKSFDEDIDQYCLTYLIDKVNNDNSSKNNNNNNTSPTTTTSTFPTVTPKTTTTTTTTTSSNTPKETLTPNVASITLDNDKKEKINNHNHNDNDNDKDKDKNIISLDDSLEKEQDDKKDEKDKKEMDMEKDNNDNSNNNHQETIVKDKEFENKLDKEIRDEKKHSGLKNLGATCYANSLVQVLFMNSEFRKNILELKLKEDPKDCIYQLQNLFANMQFNPSPVLDPTDFVKSLQLSNSQHQDIQEFFILLIGLLETKIKANSNNDIINNLFQGSYSYVTECMNCKTKFPIPSLFYELPLIVEGCKTLEDSMTRFIGSENLTGSDQYYCTVCKCKRDCSRSTQLSSIPPYLNIQFLRYTFNKETSKKKKLHDKVEFPLEFSIKDYVSKKTSPQLSSSSSSNTTVDNDNSEDEQESSQDKEEDEEEEEDEEDGDQGSPIAIDETITSSKKNEYLYELTAILMHQGMVTSGGHYISHIKDDITGKWWKFDDEKVEEINLSYLGKESKKEKRKKTEIENGTISSSGAYMVVYSKKNRSKQSLDNMSSLSSSSIVENVKSKQKEFISNQRSYQENFTFIKDYWTKRMASFNKIQDIITPAADASVYNWISTESLRKWIKGHSEPIDNKILLCKHDNLDPEKLENMKRISKTAWNTIHSQVKGGPVLNQDSVCQSCLYDIFSTVQDQKDLKKNKEYYINLEKNNSNGNSEINIDQPFSFNQQQQQKYYISKNWFSNWKKLEKVEINPIDPTTEITCKHQRFCCNNKKDLLEISAETWNFISLPYQPNCRAFAVGDFDSEPCLECTEEYEQETNLVETKKKKNISEKKELKELLQKVCLDTKDPLDYSEGDYYVLEKDWLFDWSEFMDDPVGVDPPNRPPNSTLFLCAQHSKLNFDCDEALCIATEMKDKFSLVPFVLVSSACWLKIKSIYSSKGPDITFRNGKPLSHVSCKQCSPDHWQEIYKQELEFTESPLYIHKISIKDNERDHQYYKLPSGRMSRGYRTLVQPIDNTNTVEQLKLLICTYFNIPTFQQTLYTLAKDANNKETKEILTLLPEDQPLCCFKIIPNQIIVLKVMDDDLDTFFEDGSIETGFKGTILNGS
ncbi:hypothetical protein CYY_007377 [Polysphondylium violaceum]|uniref:Ubiquitinyl hydrolase 1 n=1 Tax=Polysphondylium violaceum TaxID=133409 RepID=A0A8J4PQI1_9MYCE|nr:hypothetical protein CYY_007377 [Polysphondylium violaceum]